jgi:hypothetical protein
MPSTWAHKIVNYVFIKFQVHTKHAQWIYCYKFADFNDLHILRVFRRKFMKFTKEHLYCLWLCDAAYSSKQFADVSEQLIT